MRRKATREELYYACYVQMLTPQEIADKFGYSNPWTLWRAFQRWGIPWPHPFVGAAQLSPRQHQIITGTLLGDGYVHYNGKQCCLRVRHCETQSPLVYWMARELQPFVTPSGVRIYEPHGLQRQRVYEFTTYTHKEFTRYRLLFYREGRKVVTPEVLSRVNDLALAVWVMDDGHYDPRKGYIGLSTCSFTHAEHELMQQWFAQRYGVTPMCHKATGGYYRLVFKWEDVKRLIPRLYPHILPCMRYKLGF